MLRDTAARPTEAPDAPSDDPFALPLLSADAEATATPDELIRHNLRLALFVARREQWTGRGVEREDLEQWAYLGLVIAARGWRPSRGTRFSTYAVPVIVSHLKRACHNTASAIRVPVWLREKQGRLATAEAELYQRLERGPTDEELAAAVGWDVAHVVALRRADAGLDSLDAPLGDEAGAQERHEVVAGGADTEASALARVGNETLQAALLRLPERSRRILLSLYPLDDHTDPLTMRQVARREHISHERVRQIAEEAKAQLRVLLKEPNI